MRGVAILAVLLFHGEGRLLPGGYLGVSSFFTLSGFLITSLLLLERERTGRIDLARFWVRRLRRLMPAALLGIGLASVVVLAAGTTTQRAGFRWDGIAALAYGANFRAMSARTSYWETFSRPSPLLHYWSLSIEEQFYFVYPVLLLGVASVAGTSRRTLRLVLTVLLLASTATMIGLALSGARGARIYFGTDTRAGEFLIGALLATFLAQDGELRAWRGGRGAVTLACLAFIVVAVTLAREDAPFLYRGGFALYALATAGLLNAALMPGVVASVLSLRPLVLLGRISYGVYVYHWPIDLYLDGQRTGLAGVPLLLLQGAVTVAVATASWLLVEQPIRTARGTLGRRAGALLPVGLAASVVGVLVISGGSQTVDWAWMLNRDPMPAVGAKEPGGPVRILVFGDSLAFNIGSGIAKWASGTRGRVVVWNAAQYGCGIVQQPGVDVGLPENERSACRNWPDFWQQKVDAFEPDLVVIISGVWDLRPRPVGAPDALWPGDPAFDRELLTVYRRAVDIAASRGARVVWVNAPCVGPEAYESPLGRTGAMQPELIAHLDQTLLPALAASRPNVSIFDLFTALCPGGRFTRSIDGMYLTRADGLHLSPQAARDTGRAVVASVLPDVAGRPAAATARAARELPFAARR